MTIQKEAWYKYATRPIPVSENLVEEISQAVISQVLKDLYARDMNDVSTLPGGIRGTGKRHNVETVREGEYESFLSAVKYESFWGYAVGGAINSDKNFLAVYFGNTLTLANFKRYLKSGGENEIKDIIRHEVTHLRDVYRSESVYESDDKENYYNSAHEVRAYMRNVGDEVLQWYVGWAEMFGDDPDVEEMREEWHFPSMFRTALDEAPTYITLSNYLTEKNMALVIRGAYRYVQDKLKGAMPKGLFDDS